MILTREKTTSWATYGTLKAEGFECKTIELPFKDNKPTKSCIPKGMYDYRVLSNSKAFSYQHIEILNVPQRFGIKIHVANFVSQLKGCIAVGSDFADIDNDGIIDVINSRNTLEELIKVIPEKGKITIK